MTTPLLRADPLTVPIGSKVVQVCPAIGAGVPVLIYNADPLNIAYVGYKNGIGTTNATPVQPLTFTVMDGSRTLWGFCPTATVTLNVTPGGSMQSASPAQIAEQISLAGIPSIDVPTALYIVINQTIAAGGSFSVPAQIVVKQFQSWFATMFCTATSSGTGTDPHTKFTMQWSIDTDNNDPLITHDWVVPNTPFNFFYNYRNDCQGPIFGNNLMMTWKNYDSQPVNMTVGFFGSYRTRIRPKLIGRYHWIVSSGLPDDSRGLGSDGIAEIYNPSGMPLAAGASSPADQMCLMDGPAYINGNAFASIAGQLNLQVVISPEPTSAVSTAIVFTLSGAPGAGGELIMPPIPFMLPRRAATIQLFNLASSVPSVNSAQFLVTAQEQPE